MVTATTAIEARWRAMGSDAHVIVVPALPGLLDVARARVEELESRWSRFRSDSELMRLNARPGAPSVVSRDTFGVVERAVEAWRLTNGLFDPTVHDAIVAAGYDRDFALLPGAAPDSLPRPPVPAPGCDAIALDPIVSSVTLPAGCRLDLGGIGKGFAADLVVSHLLARGAAGACVNLGGDLRVAGTAPDERGWIVDIDVCSAEPAPVVALAAGAAATSSRLRRHWTRAGSEVHHLLDPRTGAPASDALAAVTVLAGEAWWAEALAKAAFVAGPRGGTDLLAAHSAPARLVDAAGRQQLVGDIEGFAA